MIYHCHWYLHCPTNITQEQLKLAKKCLDVTTSGGIKVLMEVAYKFVSVPSLTSFLDDSVTRSTITCNTPT